VEEGRAAKVVERSGLRKKNEQDEGGNRAAKVVEENGL
jgi:hypothetical protein